MPRKLAPCGTHAAYVRHRRNDEDCAECKESERVRRAEKRAEKYKAEMAISHELESEGLGRIKQTVRQGAEPIEITVPLGFDPLESAKWRLAKVRASMMTAPAMAMAGLAKREEEIIELLERLTEDKTAEVDPLDQLAKRREARLAEQRARTGS